MRTDERSSETIGQAGPGPKGKRPRSRGSLLAGAAPGVLGAVIATLALTVSVTATDPSATPDPAGIVAIGHSGLTGEGTIPGPPGQAALEYSWATGNAPEVRSIYQRLVEAKADTAGEASNEASAGAPAASLADQARAALAEVPAPALVIVQTIDNDIRCDGTDDEHISEFGEQVADALEVITAASPGTRILMLTQYGRPATYAAAVADVPAVVAQLSGTGMCDFFDPSSGEVRPEALTALTAIIEAYEAEQARACSEVPQCQTDGGVAAAYIDNLAEYSSDFSHLNISGQARKAELLWPAVAGALELNAAIEQTQPPTMHPSVQPS